MNAPSVGAWLLVLIAVIAAFWLIPTRRPRRSGLSAFIAISIVAAIAMLASSQRFHRVQPMTAVSYQVAPPSPKPPLPLECSDLPEVHSDQGAEVPVPEVPEIHFKNALHARESAQSVSRSLGSSYQDEKTTRPVKSAILGGGVTLGLMLLTAIFLDAERFGRYTFPVRVGSAATFVGLCLVLWNLGPL